MFLIARLECTFELVLRSAGERTKKCNLHTYCTYSYTDIFIAIISWKHIYFCTNNAHLINIASFSPKKVKVTLFVQKYLSRGLISAIFWMCANKRNIHDWRLARHTTCILHSTFIIDTTECSSRRECHRHSRNIHPILQYCSSISGSCTEQMYRVRMQ